MQSSPETTQANVEVGQILTALKNDPEFFIEFYLAEELTTPVPEFHKDIFSKMCDMEIQRCAEAVPRDHAKTTLAKLAVMYHLVCTDIRYIVYLSNTATVSISCCLDIVSFFDNPNHKEICGDTKWFQRKEAEGYYRFSFFSPFTGQHKECILSAHGRGKQVRGLNITHQRPQIAIVDDLEDEETAGSDEIFMKVKRWFYGAFVKALDKRWNKIIHIGNIHGARSLLDEHCRSDFWHSRRYGALLSNGKPLWPQMWSIAKLRLDYIQYQEMGLADLWFAEMMNNPLAGIRKLISAGEILYLPALTPGETQYGFLTLDPSTSEKKTADDLAIAVHAFNLQYHIWQIVEVVVMKENKDPLSVFHRVVELFQKWGFYICAVESYGYQSVIQPIFEHFRIIHYPFLDALFIPVNHGSSSKTAHIIAWTSLLKQGKNRNPLYALTRGDMAVTNQLLQFDPTMKNNKRDDIIDACSYGPQVTQRYMHEIMRDRQVDKSPGYQGTYEVSKH